jgi:hypothetical protein
LLTACRDIIEFFGRCQNFTRKLYRLGHNSNIAPPPWPPSGAGKIFFEDFFNKKTFSVLRGLFTNGEEVPLVITGDYLMTDIKKWILVRFRMYLFTFVFQIYFYFELFDRALSANVHFFFATIEDAEGISPDQQK